MNNIAQSRGRLHVYIGVCWLYACIHMNRQVFAILAEPLREAFNFQDQQLGALSGSAFSIVYALLGLLFGRLADRADRLKMVRIGAWVWSLAALAAAFATSYPWLIAARSGVAVGEAVATTAAVSLVAEVADGRQRARAMSVFVACAFCGAGLATILGGWVVDAGNEIAAHAGWRATLCAVSLPGMAGAWFLNRAPIAPQVSRSLTRAPGDRSIALLMSAAALLTVLVQMILPPSVGVPLTVLTAIGAACLWAWMLRRSDAAAFQGTLGNPAFRWLLCGFAAVLLVDSAAGFWLFPLAQRQFGLSATAVGAQMGALNLIGGIAGALAGGWLADRWRRKDAAGRVWTVLIAVLIEIIAILVALVQGGYPPFIASFALFCLASGAWSGVAGAIGLDVLARESRGSGIAIYFLVTTVFGPGVGPFAVGLGSDLIGSLSKAIAWSCAFGLVAVIALFGLGRLLSSNDSNFRRE